MIANSTIDRIELRAQIAQLPIENRLPFDEFLSLEDKIIVDEDVNIFMSVIKHYSADKPGKEEQ